MGREYQDIPGGSRLAEVPREVLDEMIARIHPVIRSAKSDTLYYIDTKQIDPFSSPFLLRSTLAGEATDLVMLADIPTFHPWGRTNRFFLPTIADVIKEIALLDQKDCEQIVAFEFIATPQRPEDFERRPHVATVRLYGIDNKDNRN